MNYNNNNPRGRGRGVGGGNSGVGVRPALNLSSATPSTTAVNSNTNAGGGQQQHQHQHRRIYLSTYKHDGRMPEDEGQHTCCICLVSFQKDDVIAPLPCLHLYHADCIRPWLHHHTTCPQCQLPVTEGIDAAPLTPLQNNNNNNLTTSTATSTQRTATPQPQQQQQPTPTRRSASQSTPTASTASPSATTAPRAATTATHAPQQQQQQQLYNRSNWVPDEASASCMNCHAQFRPLWRHRHHCRLCGLLLCSRCCRSVTVGSVLYRTLKRMVDAGRLEGMPSRCCTDCTSEMFRRVGTPSSPAARNNTQNNNNNNN
eukprot:PhM_4_TR17457/c6_g1_i1/m.36651